MVEARKRKTHLIAVNWFTTASRREEIIMVYTRLSGHRCKHIVMADRALVEHDDGDDKRSLFILHKNKIRALSW
jgi:hypothetical protein